MNHPPEPTRPAVPRRRLRQAFNLRTLKYGSHASLFTIIVLAVLLLLYSLAMQHNQRFDVTQAKRFTLAEQSIKLLQGLQHPIKVIGFYSLAERDRETFTDLIKQYAQHTDKLAYEVVDPDRQPALAKQYDITADNTVVVEGNGKKEKISRVEEAALTNAILKVTRNTKKVVYFVTGHGEPALTDSDRTGYSVAKQALEEQNYTVQELVLARQPQVPDDAAVVIVAGPRKDLQEAESETLIAFLNRGGHLFLMLDAYVDLDTVPALAAFVKRYGFELSNDIVIEADPRLRPVGGDPTIPLVIAYEQHPITRALVNIQTLFPGVRSVQVAKELPEGVKVQALAFTSAESWAETDLKAFPKALQEGRLEFDKEHGRLGPISIVAVANITTTVHSNNEETPRQASIDKDDASRTAKMVVFGSSKFANNTHFPIPALGNGDLFLNTVSWLAEEEDLIAIRPRKGGGSGPVMLTVAQARVIFWLPVVLLPLGVFASGAVVFIRRKWQQ